MPRKHVCANAMEAVADIQDGASILVHSFGPPQAWPTDLLLALAERGVKDLTVICNTTSAGPTSLQILAEKQQVRKLVCTFAILPVGPTPFSEQIRSGAVEVELVPQGTLIERIRAGGYGLGGVLTQTGIGTSVEAGKQQLHISGKSYLVEPALRADFALVQAFLADYLGNLGYALTARNFNPLIAMAATTVIACADNIAPVGVMSPDHVVTPAPLIDYLVSNG